MSLDENEESRELGARNLVYGSVPAGRSWNLSGLMIRVSANFHLWLENHGT